MNELRKYYEGKPLNEFWLPSNPKHRQFKFVCGKKVIKIKQPIRNRMNLKKLLIQYEPDKVYYSLASWFNPKQITNKNKKDLMLFSDLAFDFDSEDLNLAHEEALKVLEFMKRYEDRYELMYTSFSGTRGFHLVYKDKVVFPKNRKRRESLIQKHRKELVEELKELNLETLDKPFILNTRSVITLPETVKTKSGINSFIIHDSSFKELGEGRINFNDLRVLETSKTRSISQESKATTPALSPYYTRYLSNLIDGVQDRGIVILKYNDYNIKKAEQEINEIYEEYDLTPFYFIELDDIIYAVSLKSLSKSRINKIMKNVKYAENRYSSVRFKQTFMRVSQKLTNENKLYGDRPKIIKKIGEYNNKSYLSKPHLHYLNHLGLDEDYTYTHGVEQQKTTVSKITGGLNG